MIKDIKTKFDEFIRIPFPDKLNDVVIQGIDLNHLNTDTIGLIDKFISYRGQLNLYDFDLLRQYQTELQSVTRELQGIQRLYFSTLWTLTLLTIEYLSRTQRFIRDKEQELLINNWKEYYIKIRNVLNDWDILGVVDKEEDEYDPDDEYDSINFLVYKVLTNDGGLDDIKAAIKKYVNQSMGIGIRESKLTGLSIKILEIKE
jgi:hypothetical protein